MLHLDLFSGIGGFAYAVDQVWENAEHIFCDNDKFCQQVLKKHWPNSTIYGDIREITTNTTSDRCDCGTTLEQGGQGKVDEERHATEGEQKREGWECEPWKVDLLTGGFPRQPFSQAGKRRGTEDDRFLWPEMLRVIQLTKPTWIIAENVRGLLTINEGLVFEQVCLDLEGEGYEVQPVIIPAVAVNAPHRRDRVWFVANKRGTRLEEAGTKKQATGSGGKGIYASDTERKRYKGNKPKERQNWRQNRGELQIRWDKNWLEVATELCRVDDGLPAELDGFKLTKAQHRNQRLKSLGNAIVPAVAVEIMKAIKEVLSNGKEN